LRRCCRPLRRSGPHLYSRLCDIINYQIGSFMRNTQARGRVPNSGANQLPTAFYGPNSAAGGLGQIVSKLLIYNLFLMLRGGFSRVETRFFPADREKGDRASHGPTPRRSLGYPAALVRSLTRAIVAVVPWLGSRSTNSTRPPLRLMMSAPTTSSGR
jgi:hypothetical protein